MLVRRLKLQLRLASKWLDSVSATLSHSLSLCCFVLFCMDSLYHTLLVYLVLALAIIHPSLSILHATLRIGITCCV